ncbi:MAG: hypothetical protein ACOZBL_00190, partial [Patescibacteria group bacterium]
MSAFSLFRRVKISGKIFGLTFSVVVAMLLGAVSMVYLNVTDHLEQKAKDEILSIQHFIAEDLLKDQSNFRSTAIQQASRPNVLKGILSKDIDLLQKLADVLMANGVEVVVFTDNHGNVILRGHDPKRGDSIINQEILK